ncbi:MAG: glycosyltransferase family 2 protein [Chlorobium sp.]|nr:glycosyltransferase family 2 protein [Chlorobium sp.]MCF8216572.1 glycosyltransferase family 2 protein [Chlorobium sp.]MCF8270899.1 glycosyltransferase family 2 protein [Chlorobium sp.]MCF8287167.1 glycosyltransferase family 2 protein [Chlorobium sp.]MCF8290824.1 glycosyltransferase family 2 protein [Chlorobium sp.]MCF8385483.1 glycosyltransferase family 2 protein [Chlorobium sp.]
MNARFFVTVIVLNWNGKDDLLRCLGSLDPLLSEQLRVLVVDNGSSDGSSAAVRDRFPGVELLALDRNFGYAGGNNAGFRHAMKRRPEYVVFLNNDTVVAPDAVARLTAVLRDDPEAGIAVPEILYMDDPDRIWYAGGVVRLGLGLVRHEGIRKLHGPAYARRKETGYATGCCIAMRSLDFERIGGFDERFGMYAEDVDLSLRVRKAGLTVVCEPAARVWHRVSASYGSGMHPRKILRKSAAMLYLMRKHRAWSGFIFYPFALVAQAAGALLHTLARKPSGRS